MNKEDIFFQLIPDEQYGVYWVSTDLRVAENYAGSIWSDLEKSENKKAIVMRGEILEDLRLFEESKDYLTYKGEKYLFPRLIRSKDINGFYGIYELVDREKYDGVIRQEGFGYDDIALFSEEDTEFREYWLIDEEDIFPEWLSQKVVRLRIHKAQGLRLEGGRFITRTFILRDETDKTLEKIEHPKEMLGCYEEFFRKWKENVFQPDFNAYAYIYERCKDVIDQPFSMLSNEDFEEIQCLKREREKFLQERLPKIYSSLVEEYIKMAEGNIELYRYIGVDDFDAFIQKLQLEKDKGIGVNWTRNRNYPYIFGDREKGDIAIFLTAKVSYLDVDWFNTLMKNTSMGFGIPITKDSETEDEVMLKRDQKIKLISLEKEYKKLDLKELFGKEIIYVFT